MLTLVSELLPLVPFWLRGLRPNPSEPGPDNTGVGSVIATADKTGPPWVGREVFVLRRRWPWPSPEHVLVWHRQAFAAPLWQQRLPLGADWCIFATGPGAMPKVTVTAAGVAGLYVASKLA